MEHLALRIPLRCSSSSFLREDPARGTDLALLRSRRQRGAKASQAAIHAKHCGPSRDGFSNPLQRQQVSLETVSEPQMTWRIRHLTFARRLKWFTVLKDTLLGETPTAVAVHAANFFIFFRAKYCGMLYSFGRWVTPWKISPWPFSCEAAVVPLIWKHVCDWGTAILLTPR